MGANPSFARLAAEALRGSFAGLPLNRNVDAAIEHVMDGFAALEVHPDIVEGVESLSEYSESD